MPGSRFRLSSNPHVLENWALAAPPDSRFVQQWFFAFDAAVREGLTPFCERLRRENRVPSDLPGVNPLPYLTMHAVGALLLHESDPPGYIIRTHNAASDAFWCHHQAGWNPVYLLHRILTDSTLEARCSMIKLRGWEAVAVDWCLRLGWYRDKATLVRALGVGCGRASHAAAWCWIGMCALLLWSLWMCRHRR